MRKLLQSLVILFLGFGSAMSQCEGVVSPHYDKFDKHLSYFASLGLDVPLYHVTVKMINDESKEDVSLEFEMLMKIYPELYMNTEKAVTFYPNAEVQILFTDGEVITMYNQDYFDHDGKWTMTIRFKRIGGNDKDEANRQGWDKIKTKTIEAMRFNNVTNCRVPLDINLPDHQAAFFKKYAQCMGI